MIRADLESGKKKLSNAPGIPVRLTQIGVEPCGPSTYIVTGTVHESMSQGRIKRRFKRVKASSIVAQLTQDDCRVGFQIQTETL